MTEPTVPPPTPSDTLLAKVIVYLGVALVLAVIGICLLAGLEKSIPDVLATLAVTVVATLGALLAGRRP